MPRNNRELSQFASFVQVADDVKKLGIKTDLSITGGLGVGAGLTEYLDRIQNFSDPDQSLIVFNPARFLDSVTIDGQVNITSTDSQVAISSADITDLVVTNSVNIDAPDGIAIDGNITIGGTQIGQPAAKGKADLIVTNDVDIKGAFSFTSTLPAEFFGGAIFHPSPVGIANSLTLTEVPIVIKHPQLIGFPLQTYGLTVESGAWIGKNLSVGLGLSVSDYISIGSSASTPSEFLSTCRFATNVTIGKTDTLSQLVINSNIDSSLIPYIRLGDAGPSIGTSEIRWNAGFFNSLNASRNLDVSGVFNSFADASFYKSVGFITGFTAAGVSTVFTLETDNLEVINLYSTGLSTYTRVIDGVARTSLQANNIDLKEATLDQFYYLTLSNNFINQTESGGELFVNKGIYYNPISSDFYIGQDLNILGNSIISNLENPNLRFFVLNNPKAIEAFMSADELTIGGQSSSGIATIRNGQTHVSKLQVNSNLVQASTGNTNFQMNDNISTKFFGDIEIEGDSLKINRETAYIFDESVKYANLLGDAEFVDIGSQSIGIASIRNNRIDLHGDLRLLSNQIQASDGAVSIQLDSNRTVTIQGDLLVNGNDIRASTGATNITLNDNLRTIFAGDIQVNGNEIYASDGNINILMNSNQLTSVTGKLRVEGNQILAGTGATNITLLDGQQTIFAGDIRVNGNSIRASNGFVNIEMEDNIKTIFQGDIQINGEDIRGADGTICISIEAPSGNVAIGSDLTANSVFFNGNTAVLNNDELYIKDNLIDIGLLEDPNNLGTLIGPNTTTNYDAGLLLNYYSVGLSTSKKAAIFWDNSRERIAIASDVREQNPDIATIDGYAEIEAKGLVINSASGVRRLLEDDGTYLQLKRVVIDAGTY